MKRSLKELHARVGTFLNDTLSPAGSWLNFKLESAEVGKAVATLVVRHEMCNPYGNIHGGMMSLVIDEIIGFAIVSLDAEQHYTSVNLNMDFLYAIAEGETLRAEANVLRFGKKIINVEVRVYNHSTNVLLAKGTSNLTNTNMAIG